MHEPLPPVPDDVARRSAEREAAAVFGRSIDPLDAFERLGHSKLTGGVWRVTAGSETAILKVLRPLPDGFGGDEPAHFRYWPREAFVLEGCVPRPYLAAGIRGPRLLGRFDRPEGEIALWMEDVRGVVASDWETAAYGDFAERLGRAQGAYLAGEPLPAEAWWSREFLRQYLAERDSHVRYDLLTPDEAWSQPRIAASFGEALRSRAILLHVERELFLRWLAALPRTLAHLDCWSSNLYDVGGSTVMIDWAFAGVAAIGEDVGNLVPDSVFDFQCRPEMLEPLDRELFRGYLRGLRSAGWTGDERLARLGMCASAVKYEWIAAATLDRARANTPTQPVYGGGEVDADAFFSVRAAVLEHLAGWADEARSIARSLGLG